MPTEEQLTAIMPKLPADRRQAFLPFLQRAIEEFDIAAPLRQAAFLAQLAHESGQLRFMEEIWGPTPNQVRYEPVTTLSASLGNTEVGDGRRFKGRGPIQLTGRSNYQRFGPLLGLDLIADPAQAATPEVAFRIAGLYWKRNGLNELADQATPDAFVRITKRINGGTIGLPDRQRFYAVAREVFGVAEAAPAAPARATRSARVVAPAPVLEVEVFARGAEAIPLAPRARRAAAKKTAKKKAAKKTTEKKTAKTRAPARKARAASSANAKPKSKATKRTAKKVTRRLAKKR